MLGRIGALSLTALLAGVVANGQTRPAGPTAKKITRDDAVAEKTEFSRAPRVALVVGVGEYPRESGLSRLNFAGSDAEETARVLKDQGYIVRLLRNQEALRGSVRRALTELGKAVEPSQGTFLFYFSGHGFAFDNVNYLATYGTTVDDLKSEGLPLPEVEKFLKASGAKRQLMFVDACRNEPTIGGKSVQTPTFVLDRRDRLAQSEGLRILYSTKAGTVSYENPELQQGVYTYFLLKALRGEASGYAREDRKADQVLTFADTAAFMIEKMRAYGVERGQVQIPYEAGESSGDFLIAGKMLPPAPPKPPLTSNLPPRTDSGPPAGNPSPVQSGAPPPQPQANRAAGGIGALADPNAKGVLSGLPQVWRNVANNQLYHFRFDDTHLYITQQGSNNIIADLILKSDKDKKKPPKYEGSTRLTNCPGGAGFMEVTSWSPTRIEARVEVLPNVAMYGNAAPTCGGFFGKGRAMVQASFIPEGN
jgi:hypothetical protein